MTDGRPLYFDRQGRPISLMHWAALREADFDETCRVAHDDVDLYHVSTVWIGLDLGYLRDGPPLIFETMTFLAGEALEVYRYATEDQARAGHAAIVAEIREAAERAAQAIEDAQHAARYGTSAPTARDDDAPESPPEV